MQDFLSYCLTCQGRGFWLLLCGAYVLGSVPFGWFLGRVAGLGDVRAQGSGNIGATNLARLGGKKLGALTLLLDGAKGACCVWLARFVDVPLFGQSLIMAAAVCGHIFSCFLGGKGGKGVATFFASLTVLVWPLGVFGLAVWLLLFVIKGISSLAALGSMVAIGVASLWLYCPHAWGIAAVIGALCMLIIAKHHSNIRRLLRGEE